MKNKEVVILCGDYPENHITPDIGNDPNFVFQNDPNFLQVRLFDSDGNTVLVNSFMMDKFNFIFFNFFYHSF